MLALEQALSLRLNGDTGTGGLVSLQCTGAFEGLAPQGQAFPYIVWQLQGSVDHDTHACRSWEDLSITVKAVDKGPDQTRVSNIAERIDALLNRWTLQVAGFFARPFLRERRLEMTEVDEGIVYKYRGGVYRTELYPRP